MRLLHLFFHTMSISMLLASSSQTGLGQCGTCNEPDRLCGPIAVQAVCQGLGVTCTMDQAKALSGFDEKRGTSLLGLQSAVTSKGLRAVSMKIGSGELATFKGQIIAHLWGNHFIAVEAGEGDSVRIADPPRPPRNIKKSDFDKVYSGFALLIARDATGFPEPKAEGPDLRFDRYGWDFGSLDSSYSARHSFKCRNVGNADLMISKVQSSCEDCIIPLDYAHDPARRRGRSQSCGPHPGSEARYSQAALCDVQ